MKFYYPTALVRLHVRLIDVGQPDPDDLLLLEFPVVSLTVEINHFNEADTVEVVVDYEDFPVDPRIVRGATIEAFIANQENGLDPNFWEKTDVSKHAVFAGVADEIEMELDSDEGRSFRIRGRDYTAFFIDAELPSAPISFVREGRRLTIVEVLEDIIQQRPETQALEVVAEGLSQIAVPAGYKADGDNAKGSRFKRRGESVWDAMVELAYEAGLIVYVVLDQVVLREPHTLFLREGMDESRFYRWTLGENIKRFQPRRLLGRQEGINVRCVSYDVRTGKALAAVAPRDAKAAEATQISAARVARDDERGVVKQKRLKVRPYVFRGITDADQLQRIADELYELLRFHDTECAFSSDDLEDSTGKSVFGLRFGDPIAFDAVEQFRSVLAFSAQEQVDRLIAIGYPREAAEPIATALDRLTVPFYVSKVRHQFRTGNDGGYSLDVVARARKQVEIGELTPDQAAEAIE